MGEGHSGGAVRWSKQHRVCVVQAIEIASPLNTQWKGGLVSKIIKICEMLTADHQTKNAFVKVALVWSNTKWTVILILPFANCAALGKDLTFFWLKFLKLENNNKSIYLILRVLNETMNAKNQVHCIVQKAFNKLIIKWRWL